MINSNHNQELPKIDPKKGTILLVSGSLDHALLAFEIAVGMQAMGIQINMWFVLQGVNLLLLLAVLKIFLILRILPCV